MSVQSGSLGGFKVNQLALCVALAIPALVHAQESVVLPEVKVQAQSLGETTEGTGSYTTGKSKTATPLSMSLRDTPQSVSVVTQQRIEDQGLRTITDVINNVTGVSVNKYETNRAQFTARGFDINNLQIDGVPTTWAQPWSSGEIQASLAVYDRVEVVRGSTGLMTGAGDPSAAINLVRKRASSKELTGSIEVGAGSWDQRNASFDVMTPVNDAKTLRLRVAGEHIEGDSWVDLAKNKSQTLFAAVEADLTPNTILAVGISRQETDSKGPMWGGLPFWYSDGTKANWDVSKTTSADWTSWDTAYENRYVNLEHRFDSGWKARASYTQGERDADSFLLYLFGRPDPVTGLGMGGGGGSYKTHTEQDDIGLSASGPFQLAGRTHELAVGYIHSKQKFNADTRGYIPVAVGDFNNWDGSVAEPAWGPLSFYETSETTQQAVYGVARFSLSDPLKLILGIRATDYKKSGDTVYTDPYSMKASDELTPYAGLIYDINDTYSTYISYTDIFQPQNYFDVSGKPLEPAKGKSTEAGVKGEFMDGRLNAAFAVFHIVQEGLGEAVPGVFVPGTADPAYRAVSPTSDGFEVELSGEFAAGWNATVGYSQFDAQNEDGSAFNSIYPRQLFRVFTTYRLPGEWNALTIGGGVNWESRTNTKDPFPPPGSDGKIEQESYAIVNLMARYEFDKQLSAQLNINNVFDEKYFGMFAAYSAITYGAPRNATASIKYKF